MPKRKSGTEKAFEEIVEAIALFFKWLYDNIVWGIIAILAINVLLFIMSKTGLGYLLASINFVILAVFSIRLWKDR